MELQTLCPASLVPNSWSWLINQGQQSTSSWTKEENKKFESALAMYDDKVPDRWFLVAAMIPGKSVYDVMNQYMELVADVSDIEAGLVPVPGYSSSSCTSDLDQDGDPSVDVHRKRVRTRHSFDQERKRGVPWTQDEHRRFLLGLKRHGKGDWRNISRNFVITKTPTQVASHAQKYYLRQLCRGNDKRRPSIHDITTVDLTTRTNNDKSINELNHNTSRNPTFSNPNTSLDNWNHNNINDGGLMMFDSTNLAARPDGIIDIQYMLNIGASASAFRFESSPGIYL